MAELKKRNAVSARALELIILTATRSSEARKAKWHEFDLNNGLWIIPPERMKMGLEHRIPLSPQAVSVLNFCKGYGSEYVFPANNLKSPLSDMVFFALMKRMDYSDLTTHGFRSTFRDWCSEHHIASRDAAELSLAHRIGNATERAYARSDLLEQRRELMNNWTEFAYSKCKA